MIFEVLILAFIVWTIIRNQKKKEAEKGSTAIPNQPPKIDRPGKAVHPTASAEPNKPKTIRRTKQEEAVEIKTRASSAACGYKAAYSQGRPDRLGIRGDYEPQVPAGMIRMKCAYCGAESFVPANTREHYHCHFCWEKL
jgi:hypothetical protein